MFLAHKITKAKWTKKTGIVHGGIPADAITADLRTRDNTLSFWKCGSGSEESVRDVILALATNHERIEKIEVAWISDEDLKTDNQNWKSTDGETRVPDLITQHVDIYHLDYIRLGKVAHRVMTALDEGHYLLLTRARVRKLIAAAVVQNRVELATLQDKVRDEVVQLLATTE